MDVHTKDSDGETALSKAAFWGDVEAVEALLAAGANVDEPGDMGCTPLYYAVTEGHAKAAETLLAHGANPDAVNELGTTPRMKAASSSANIRVLFERR
jgi:ankyrin repeat protein